MKKLLRISDSLALPIDAATQKFAWLGRTGSGKTFAAKRLVEQMLRSHIQVVILDGVGVWPGLRLGPKSFDIPVLGGLYGDIPLEPTGGALVADVIVDSGTSMVIDVSQMLDAERTRFATAFAQRFFQRKKASRGAVHLVLEECQDYVPQNFQSGEERMLHEFQRIAKQGRSFGIGLSLISQRPQEISKKALNQTECVFAFQMTGPQERKALEYWLSDKGFDGKLSDILPRLEVGSPHVWSPQWLKISKVVRILPIDSLDTSSTPKVGEKAFKQNKLKPIDMKGLTAAMAETVERAKADDPKQLRVRIAELEKALKARVPATPPSKPVGRVLAEYEVAIHRNGLKEIIESTKALGVALDASDKVISSLRVAVNTADRLVRRAAETGTGALSKELAKAPKTVSGKFLVDGGARPPSPNAAKLTAPSGLTPRQRALRATASVGGARDPSIGDSGLCRMLIALAQRPEGLSRRSLALRAGLSSRTGTFGNYLSRARVAGWIEGKSDFRITDEGTRALGPYEPLPTGAALFDYWLREIGDDSGAARMLRTLSSVYPSALSRADLAAQSNLSAATGTFGNYLSRLRGLELIEGKSEIRLSEELVG